MRLLALSNYYPPHSLGSYELQCYQVCHELGNRGHQVRILTSKPPDDSRNRQPLPHVHRELELYRPEPGQEQFHQLFRLVRTNQKALRQHLETFHPDAVVVWGMDRLPTSLLETIEASGIPCLYAVYDFWLANACSNDRWWSYWNRDERTDSAVIRPLLRAFHLDGFVTRQAAIGKTDNLRFDSIFFCSESLKQETIKCCNLSLPNARVIPCAISPEEIRTRREPPTGQTFQVLYVARLTAEKDPMTAIRAIQELRHRGDDRFTLDIFGRGTPAFETALHDYVRRFQLGGAIRFKPMVEEQVRNSIHHYDALVCTSRDPEPFPLIHLKAMSARVPVISTMNGGSQELVRPGENGLSFEAGNHHALAEKIVQLADNPESTKDFTDAAHAEVTQHYTVPRITSRIESLLFQMTRNEGCLEEEAV